MSLEQQEAILKQYADPSLDETPPRTQEQPPRESWRDRKTSRTATAKAAPKQKVKEPASKKGEFIEPLTDLYNMIGMGVMMMDVRSGHEDHTCGTSIAMQSEKIAEAWDDLAQKNDSVRRTLRKLTQGGAWAGVIGAHLPIAVAIASNHLPGALPAGMITPEPQQEPEPTAEPSKPTVRRRRPTKKAASSPATAVDINTRRSNATDG